MKKLNVTEKKLNFFKFDVFENHQPTSHIKVINFAPINKSTMANK